MKYKDPLHFGYEHLTIEYEDQSITLNKSFIDQQNCWKNLDKIKDRMKRKLVYYDLMGSTDNQEELKSIAEAITANEFHIQELFGFDRNINFHRFWEMPKCSCPVMDNQDAWGTSYSIYNEDCLIHGEKKDD